MATGFQINGIDLDIFLQKRSIQLTPNDLTGTALSSATLPTPSPDFTGYQLNGVNLLNRYAAVDSSKLWQKKLPRSYLSNGDEIPACLNGRYPVRYKFLQGNARDELFKISRTDFALRLDNLSTGAFEEYPPSQFPNANQTIPSVIGIAIAGAGGGGGGGNGTLSGGGGGGGASASSIPKLYYLPNGKAAGVSGANVKVRGTKAKMEEHLMRLIRIT